MLKSAPFIYLNDSNLEVKEEFSLDYCWLGQVMKVKSSKKFLVELTPVGFQKGSTYELLSEIQYYRVTP